LLETPMFEIKMRHTDRLAASDCMWK